jgi:hypothetical protein
MGKRVKKVREISYKVVEEGHVPRKVLTATEIRDRVYGLFEIFGFFIVDGRYLFCFLSYIDHEGNMKYTVRLFMSTIEFMPFALRAEIYKDIVPYLKEKLVKNPHLMITDKDELEKFMRWRPRTLEIL